jgi:DNA-binding transcriptional regulator Cro
MLKSDVIAYYGGIRAVAEALKLSTQAVTAWKALIPEINAWRIYSLTKGELTINQALYA